MALRRAHLHPDHSTAIAATAQIVRNFVDTPVRERLERLRERVALGEFGKQAERERSEVEAEAVREQAAGLIGEAAGKILSQNHGQRYYDWRLAGEERLEYWENESCAQEKRREGYWLLETELGAVEAVRAYQELWRVEAAFRSMKDGVATKWWTLEGAAEGSNSVEGGTMVA